MADMVTIRCPQCLTDGQAPADLTRLQCPICQAISDLRPCPLCGQAHLVLDGSDQITCPAHQRTVHLDGSPLAEASPAPPAPAPVMPTPTVPTPTMPTPTMPQPTMPQPTMPQPTMPQPTMPQPTMPQPTMPQPSPFGGDAMDAPGAPPAAPAAPAEPSPWGSASAPPGIPGGPAAPPVAAAPERPARPSWFLPAIVAAAVAVVALVVVLVLVLTGDDSDAASIPDAVRQELDDHPDQVANACGQVGVFGPTRAQLVQMLDALPAAQQQSLLETLRDQANQDAWLPDGADEWTYADLRTGLVALWDECDRRGEF